MTENINLTDALKKYFGFDTFKGNQEAIIRNLLAGNDTFVLRAVVNRYAISCHPLSWMEQQSLYLL